MHRPLLAAALVATAPLGAQAQTARTDTAPARPIEALSASADARLPVSVPADQVSDAERARRLASLYQRQTDLIQADADGDDDRYAVLLDALVADVQAAALREGALADPRFRELFSSVVTEYERYYDRTLVDRGDVYAIRAAGVEAIERGYDEGVALLEHVTLPDVETYVATVPMDVNPKVERYLQFLMNRPEHVQRLRQRADTYFPMIERILAEEGVPDEMKYLAMVESALNPVARSHAAAVGMWQFISATGRAYGLRAEREIDDRMDPEASTRAAARHLRDLYDRFGSWHLALAGYNCNPAVIARGVRRFEERTGQTATFWDIDHVIPRETRAYVPMYIATALILSNPEAYGFEPHEPGTPYVFDRIPVAGGTRLADVAAIVGTDAAVIRALNPSLKQNRVPDVRVPHMLRIPAGTYAEHAEALDRLAPPEATGERWAAETVTFGERADRPLAPQEHGEGLAQFVASQTLRRSLQPQRYVRQEGSVEAYAAATPASVEIAQARISAGTAEPTPEAAPEPAFVARTEPTRPANRREAEPAAEPETPEAPPVRVVSEAAERPTTHRVERGEYLYSIARRYGMTPEEIRALNPGLGDNIRVGQQVRVSGTPAPRAAAPARPATHRVQRGEHLTGIAQRYGVTIRQLREWNDLDSDVLHVGQRLRVAPRGSRG